MTKYDLPPPYSSGPLACPARLYPAELAVPIKYGLRRDGPRGRVPGRR